MEIPRKTLERKLFRAGYRYIYAVDEVGIGCLAGPVVVCAVSFAPEFYKTIHKDLSQLRDSKLLQPQKRKDLVAKLLKKKHFKCQLAYCYLKTIDRLNIYQAARGAMKRAVRKLEADVNKKSKKIVLVDGKTRIKGLDMEQLPVIKGDRKIFAIASASIVAKVFRDRMMIRYAKRFPEYGFERHKGYGTKFHKEQIRCLGPCILHRKSFRW